MFRPSLLSLLGITLGGVLLALLLLPGIAGLIEGDFDYPRWRFREGWNNQNEVYYPQALADVYAWSFWRVGLRGEAPESYKFFELIELIKSSTSPSSHFGMQVEDSLTIEPQESNPPPEPESTNSP
jgi:hypothetical protein